MKKSSDMTIRSLKCDKEIRNGNICLSMIAKKELCSDCATIEDLKTKAEMKSV